MNHNTNKILQAGFTIVELLVVIAIIAVLASIVLVSVTQYISSSKNASIKANLASVVTAGSAYYESNNSNYGVDSTTNFCNSSGFQNSSSAITNIGETAACHLKSDYSAWCACSPLLTSITDSAGSTFCVDSTGAKKETTTACGTECTATNAFCQ